MYDEIVHGHQNPPDRLAKWARQHRDEMFGNSNAPAVFACYGRAQEWVRAQTRFTDAAKEGFGQVADAWLIAFAQTHGYIVVTHEVAAPESKRTVKIPDVCAAVGVPWVNVFEMLARLGVQLR